MWKLGHACFKFAGFQEQKNTQLMRPYGELLAKKELAISMLGFMYLKTTVF